MKTDSQEIIIYTDGASSGNPGPGGWGTLIVDTKSQKVFEMGEYLAKTTNNETELLALLEGIRKLSEITLSKDIHIYVYLDSEYVRNGVTKWMKGWKKNNWVTSTGSGVKNQELWMAISDELEHFKKVPIDYIHVDGHVGIPGNERVNEIAQRLSKKEYVEFYEGALSKYSLAVEQLKVEENTTPKKSKASVKDGWYVSLVDGQFQKHITWAECESRVKGKKAFFKKVTTLEEEEAWRKRHMGK